MSVRRTLSRTEIAREMTEKEKVDVFVQKLLYGCAIWKIYRKPVPVLVILAGAIIACS